MRRDESWRLVAWTSAAKIYWVLATLVTAAITARFLGPAGRGVLVAAIGWVTMFSTFGFLSLSQVVVFLAAGKEPDAWLPRVLGSMIAIAVTVALLGSILAAALYFATGGKLFHHIPAMTLLIAFVAFPFMLWIENGNGVLMALGKLPVLNGAQVAGGTAALLLTFLAVGPLRLGINGAVGAWALAQGVIVLISLTYAIRRARTLVIDRAALRDLLGGGAKLHLNAIGTYLFTQANILILNHYRTANETAWFQLAVQIITAIQIIPMAVSTVAYTMVSKHGPDGAWPQQRKLLVEVVVLVIALGVIAYFVSPWVVPFVFGRDFAPAIPILRILLLSIPGIALSSVMASQWISRGLFVQAAGITLMTGALTVLGNYMFVPSFGMRGAAWVTVGTWVLSIIGNGGMILWVQSQWRAHAG
ncbi:MAG TPA: oligosaccharide flippase family protein [Thermoanaerobaculia bacterium]|nr:oligosaccharide flippase family protein [Thermoanaerobaculia bacterium]